MSQEEKRCWRCRYEHSGFCCDWDQHTNITDAGVCQCPSAIVMIDLDSNIETCGNCGRYTQSSIDADWRLSLSPDLDRFAQMILDRDFIASRRRIIRNALGHYRKLLTERSEREFPGNPYTTDLIERGEVSAMLLELYEEQDN